MSLTMSRRSLLAGFLSTLAAPAVVKADMLMPIKMWRYGPRPVVLADGILLCNGSELSRVEYPDLFQAMGSKFGDGDGKYTFLIPKVGSMENPVALIATEGTPAGMMGQAFALKSNLFHAMAEDFPDRKVEWTIKARTLAQTGDWSLGYIKPDLRPYELGKVEDSVRAYARGYAHSGTKMMEYDRKYLISRIMYDHSLPSCGSYDEQRIAVEAIVDKYL